MKAFIDQQRNAFGVEPLCKVLQIAPSAYWRHAALVREPHKRCARAKRDELLMPQIQRVWQANMQVYGADKVWRQLRREGVSVARCTIERLMRKLGLRGAMRGKVVRTTVGDAKAPCPLDRVNRQFLAERPNQLWVSDFTYVSTWQGWLYVAFVVDVFARRIVGWRVSSSMRTDFVLDALEQALYARQPERDGSLICHSDRGSQYVSIRYTERLREGAVRVKAVYLAIGITMTGDKEVLGLWLAQTEGAKFWLQVVTELRNRGVQDIFIACVDGLKGFPDAIEAVFPQAVVQLCIVHMVRHSLNYVSWKRRKEVAADLRRIYTAATAEEAELMLGEFEARWDAEYLPIGQSWRRNWSRLTPFFDYPPEIRKVIYTTNAIESVNMSLRKLTKNRGSFPSDEALTKLFYLALRNISQKWTMPIRDWKAALTRFTIQFGDRISVN